ncbi:MAG: hypothetical protein KAZ28_06175 [Bacteroidaceae bacterium]|jgi:tetratricopeptide (TPR) repeat protein|nr:hypothetical protein [Bacteroidaceae bacterium]
MKAIKYLLMGAMMIGFSAPTMAQDNKATIDAISKVIKDKSGNVDDQVKDVYKSNKKNAEVLVGIGRAYLDVKDTANAKKYADLAIKADKKYAPGYILHGDIEVIKDDGGAAAGWYQQAIYFDPKNPDGYFKYASIYRGRSPEEAVSKLEDLRTQRPDIAVDALAARIYYSSNRFDKAIESYEKVDRSKLDNTDLTNYAMAAYLKQDFKKSLDVSAYGTQKDPRKAAFNRLAFFNSTDLKDYPTALKYADALFNKSDSAKFSYLDYTYYGHAFMGVKQYDNAIAQFKKALAENIERKEIHADVLKQISDAYEAKGSITEAVTTYNDYLKDLPKVTASDLAGLGTLYTEQADKLTGAAKTDAYKNADKVYADLSEQFPAAVEFAYFMRARVNSYMDPETKTGLSKPYYEKLAELINAKAEKDNTDNTRLIECYRYLGYFYYLKKDTKTADTYWHKILAIDPSNETAKQALGK